MATLQTFRQYRISQDRAGGTVELWRSGTEVACLAVDTQREIFVELHVTVSPPEQPLDVRAFQQLVQLATPLRHRHLLGVIEGGEDEGAHFFVTEFLDGERFDTWLARCNPLPPWLALQTVSQVVDGLCALAPHPRLLAGVELLNCGITLAGDHAEDITARICDIGLSSPASRQPDPRQTEARLIGETGRLLLYMLTGVMQSGPLESLDLNTHSLAPELGFLLGTLFMPGMTHHPRTLEQLRTLVERCARDLPPELAARPEKVPPTMRPKLPLQPHFISGTGITDIAGDDCTVDIKPFDALDPYRHRATQRATRTAVTVQVLPPARLMPPDYGKLIMQAGEHVAARDHPHLLRVLAWDEQEHPELLLEECPGRWTLESIVRLKGKLDPPDAALILQQLEAAAREAESIGLAPVIRSPRQILVQFTAPGGEEALPPEVELKRQSLENWPAFRLRVRTWPVTLNFTQPERFNAERLIHREPGVVESTTGSRGPSFAQQPTARDFALLAAWMLGGTGEIPERVRPLIYDHLSNRSEAALGGRKEFLERFTARASARPSGQTGPVRPRTGGSASAPPTRTAPVFLGQEAVSFEGEAPGEAPPGFAEALFGAAKARTGPVQSPAFMPEADDAAFEDEHTFLDGPLPGLHDADDGGYDPELEASPPEPNRLFLWLFVVLVAAVLAGIAAHLNGTAFWLR
jgi:hypothetical protein